MLSLISSFLVVGGCFWLFVSYYVLIIGKIGLSTVVYFLFSKSDKARFVEIFVFFFVYFFFLCECR